MYKTLTEENSKKIPLNLALLAILISTLLISGSAFMGWLYYLHLQKLHLQDDHYRIVALMQKSSSSDRLTTSYLAELLNLSVDYPSNLYQFNIKEGEKLLNASPLIKKGSIHKIRPGTLLIDYELRTPLAYLGDYTNSVIDEEGVIFPYHPFFIKKRLPTFYLGLTLAKVQWGDCLKNKEEIQLAFDFFASFKKLNLDKFFLRQLDVADAEAESYGQRQLVVVLESLTNEKSLNSFSSLWYLRLNPDSYHQNLKNFISLVSEALPKDFVHLNGKKQLVYVDLRLPSLAFIKQEKPLKE